MPPTKSHEKDQKGGGNPYANFIVIPNNNKETFSSQQSGETSRFQGTIGEDKSGEARAAEVGKSTSHFEQVHKNGKGELQYELDMKNGIASQRHMEHNPGIELVDVNEAINDRD